MCHACVDMVHGHAGGHTVDAVTEITISHSLCRSSGTRDVQMSLMDLAEATGSIAKLGIIIRIIMTRMCQCSYKCHHNSECTYYIEWL